MLNYVQKKTKQMSNVLRKRHIKKSQTIDYDKMQTCIYDIHQISFFT